MNMKLSIVVLLCSVYAVYSFNPCPYGEPLANHYCGRGGSRCPNNYYCEIAPNDAYAECCPKICQKGVPLVSSDGSTWNCGRGGVRCPDGFECNIAPTDAWAVCCQK
ncbi:uncharacterized protein LOC128211814 [Mya arenaria]|uniref:uncharacterized protein LOC128211814 n=1 Tax=Mya arenaria TaxID=6604 RepID=UPI0022E205D3|nr:uncharacterized protein LOC128211814 [Mya arenaria]